MLFFQIAQECFKLNETSENYSLIFLAVLAKYVFINDNIAAKSAFITQNYNSVKILIFF